MAVRYRKRDMLRKIGQMSMYIGEMGRKQRKADAERFEQFEGTVDGVTLRLLRNGGVWTCEVWGGSHLVSVVASDPVDAIGAALRKSREGR